MVIMMETGPNCSFRSIWERSPGKGGKGGMGSRPFSPALTVTVLCFPSSSSLLLSAPCLNPTRHSQQGPPGALHCGNAPEDVQPRAAGLLCVPLQPLRLLHRVWGYPGDHPGGDQDHVSPGHLCAEMRAPAQDLQDHQVCGCSLPFGHGTQKAAGRPGRMAWMWEEL